MDGPGLNRPQTSRVQRRQPLETMVQCERSAVARAALRYPSLLSQSRLGHCARSGQPFGQRLRTVEGEDLTAARIRVQTVGEPGFDASALVEERERAAPGRQVVRESIAVLLGLPFHTSECEARRLGFNRAGGLLIDVQDVISPAMAGFQPELSYGNALAGVQVNGPGVLSYPGSLG